MSFISVFRFSSRTKHKYDGRSYFGEDFTMKQVGSIFSENGINVGVNIKRASLLANSEIEVHLSFLINIYRSNIMLWM